MPCDVQRVESPTTGRQAIRLTRASPAEVAAFSRRQLEVRVGQRACPCHKQICLSVFSIAGHLFSTQAAVNKRLCSMTACLVQCLASAGSRHLFLACSDMCCTHMNGLQTMLLSRSFVFRTSGNAAFLLASSPCRVRAQERVAAIQDAAGFTAVFEAMRDSGKPAIGHHMSLDLTFSLAAFAGPLPGRWPDYKLMVQHWLPGALLSGPSACTY